MKHLYSLLSKKAVLLFLFSFFALAIQAQAQEICDDGVDNDGDNFIDYYDPDCACTNVNYFGWCTPQCLYTEGFTAFSMEQQWASTDVVPTYNTPIVADLDQDGSPEVIMMGMTGFSNADPRRTSGIRIINGSTGQTKLNFASVYMAWVSPHPIAVADVDGDGFGEIIVAALDHANNAAGDRGRLVCYDRNGTRLWTSSAQFGANASRRFGSALGVADFNGDGIPEVYCYNEIFNARTGVKLLTAGAPHTAARGALNDNGWGHMASPAAADLTSDPGLELACGNVVFNIDITNTAGTAGNTMTGVPIVTVPGGTVVTDYDDGFTAIADIDGDGQLDVVVTTASSGGNNRALYVWNPRTQSIIAGTTDNAGGNSGIPFIGDIDNDKKPEIGITRTNRVMAYEYVGTTTLSRKWQLATTDGSGFTGITMFDFNQDGVYEMVYRDESRLRIMDGSGSAAVDKVTLPCISGTGADMAVVADLDGDGAAEICVTCGTIDANRGTVRAFQSDKRPWAPSRKVWNQYNYQVVNINDNLTVPRTQQNHAIAFSAGLPLNNALVQATLFDKDGTQIYPAADASVKIVGSISTGLSLTVNFKILNNSIAAVNLAAGTVVSFFNGDPAFGGTLLSTFTTTVPIAPGNSISALQTMAYPGGAIQLYAVINTKGTVTPIGINDYEQAECDYTNNGDNLLVGDNDNDGVADNFDIDDDNDGILDVVEGLGNNPSGDDDIDGIPNCYDPSFPGYADINGDGVNDNFDQDFDGVPNHYDLDADNDGINDLRESGMSAAQILILDTDNNGILDGIYGANGYDNGAETAIDNGTPIYTVANSDNIGRQDFIDLDSDNDGINDIRESGNIALDSNNDGVVDGTDADGDGILDGADGNDVSFGDANDTLPADTDNDGVANYKDLDSDNDGINDVREGSLSVFDTDNDGRITPADVNGGDTDNDGIPNVGDGNPAVFGDLNETVINTDNDNVPDYLDLDSDNDGINDVRENGFTALDANNDGRVDGTDADADGILSSADGFVGIGDASDPTLLNTDGADSPNFRDLDADNDSVNDIIEAGLGALDTNLDGIVNGTDSDNDGILSGADGSGTWGDAVDAAPTDTDTDSTPNYIDLDSDADGIFDIVEEGNGAYDANLDGMVDNTIDNDKDGIVGAVDGNPAGYGDLSDNDGDSIANVFDLDADNDGIPNLIEGGGVNPSADLNGDGIINYADPSYPGFTDINGDGVHDLFDKDLDGIPNHLDLDSDNDGIADVIEAGGIDANGDGVIDFSEATADLADANNNGIIDNIQATDPNTSQITIGTASGGFYALANAAMDTDGDGVPDYLDLDSDNDGIFDVREALGTDVNNDGRLDFVGTFIANDVNGNGWLNSKDGNSGGTSPIRSTGTIGSAPSAYLGGNADSDYPPNFRDLDSDNDGINDVREAGLADSDGNGLVGTGVPVVNADGVAPTATSNPLNSDRDLVPNYIDLDSDNDGINDVRERLLTGFSDANNDGLIDGADTDGDGIRDAVDGNVGGFGDTGDAALLDTDSDGVSNYIDLDSDNDGINDLRENIVAENILNTLDANEDGMIDALDTDGDGIQNGVDGNVSAFGDNLDPTLRNGDGDPIPNYVDLDSDNDGINDVIEGGYASLDDDKNGLIDGADVDGDGIRDAADGNDSSFGDLVDALQRNTDKDGVPDFVDLDSDNDGINDVDEAGLTDVNRNGRADGTDADGDGIFSSADGFVGFADASDPTATDSDSDGIPDYRDLDSDNDSVNDIVEGGNSAADADSDGIADGTDADNDGIRATVDTQPLAFSENANPLPTDTDSDGIPDYRDLDSDNDGTRDIVEAGNASLDPNADGRVDDTTDGDGDGIVGGADGNTAAFGDKSDNDGDGIANASDLDSDNDGIPDLIEGKGIDPGADADADGLPNYADPSFAGFVDINLDGINDNFDQDRDGIPNFLDLDSDNDAIPDVIEGGGLDANGDGIIDFSEANADLADADNNGLIDNIQATSASASQLTAGIAGGGFYTLVNAALDTDGDTVPDYLDLDSDNDGINDVAEAAGTDANNDGIIDFVGVFSANDFNGNGWIDTKDGLIGGVSPVKSTGTVGNAPTVYTGPTSNRGANNDGDAIPNFRDLDSDNDGINDVREAGNADGDGDGRIGTGAPVVDAGGKAAAAISNPRNADNDAVSDYLDIDSDNDGINDIRENGNTSLDADSDGLVDGTDTDGDGIVGAADTRVGFGDTADAALSDTDSDGVPNIRDLDSDNDGINDLRENLFNISGFDANNDGMIDGSDTDGDGIRNSVDGATGTYGDSADPVIRDRDGDGVANFLDLDSDNDGINDVREAFSTNNDNNGDGRVDGADSDGDGILDNVDDNDLAFGDQNDPALRNTDGDSSADWLDLDSDNDGINDVREGTLASLDADGDGDVDGTDADGDGIMSGADTQVGFGENADTAPTDTDGDAIPDYRDLDSDNDSVNDVVEAGYVAFDSNGDGIVNGTDVDADGIRNLVDGSASVGDAADPLPTSSDGDGIPDYRDPDSDGDGIFDIVEVGSGILDGNGDGRVDNTSDSDGDGIVGAADGNPSGYGDNGDNDNDGVANLSDRDDDNDGIPDLIEGKGLDPSADHDADGIPNFSDPQFPGRVDSNGDGVDDNFDQDLDGVPNHHDLDSDNDGIADVVEAGGVDANNDGVVDYTEIDPSTADLNDNGIIDNIEGTVATTSKLTAGIAGGGFYSYVNAAIDTDGDGIADFLDLDADNDGIFDVAEAYGTDADNNGILDFAGLFAANDANANGWIDAIDGNVGGIALVTTTGTAGSQPTAYTGANADADANPNFRDLDSDNDGITDVRETGASDPDNNGIIGSGAVPAVNSNGVATGTTSASINTDGDFVANYIDLDSDNDGISDVREGGNTANDANNDGILDGADTDGDGLRDAADALVGFGDSGDPTQIDTDGDNTPDFRDLDSDNDGINDIREGGKTPADANNDGMVDGPADADRDGIRDAADNDDAVFGDNGDVAIPDTDSDGVANYKDLDSDNDGTNDVKEGSSINLDTNGDGIVDGADSDGDGILDDADGNSAVFGDLSDASVVNSDGDAAPDYLDLDSDNDGINDVYENGKTALDANNDGMIDGTDTDGDGIRNTADGNVSGFGDNADTVLDTDGDGVVDMKDLDSDNDGIMDVNESLNSPSDANGDGRVDGADTDGDGIRNLVDGNNGGFGDAGTPPTDTDGDLTPDFQDTDADGDASMDRIEGFDDDEDGDAYDDLPGRAAAFEAANGNPGIYINGLDTDGDGLQDWLDDSDGDGIPNYLDPNSVLFVDTDGDGLIDLFDSNSGGVIYGGLSGEPDNDSDGNVNIRDNTDVVILPLRFLSFVAEKREKHANLRWKTTAERNASHFEVEKSYDNKTFVYAGKVKAKGRHTSDVNTYEWRDTEILSGTAYYRIKQVDFDGQFEYSAVAVLSEKSEEMLNVYPNVATDDLYISLESDKVEAIQLVIIDVTGVVVYKHNYEKEKGVHIVPVKVDNLPSGSYFVNVLAGEKRYIRKVVVVR